MTAPRHPLGHVRDTVLDLPEYDLKILLNGYPAHSVHCRRGWAHRDRIRQPDYDPSDRVRNECLDVVCDCGTDGRYAQYLEDQLTALRAQLEATQIETQGMRAALDGHAGTHNPYLFQGPAEHRTAWRRGQQAVEAYGSIRNHMGFEKAKEVAGVITVNALTTLLSACELQQTDLPEARPYMVLSMEVFEAARMALAQQPLRNYGAAPVTAWEVVQAIATAEPPIGAQEARIFARKALAQAGAGDQA